MLSKKFISATTEYNTYEKHISAPYFKRVFQVKNVEKAQLTICGLGFYDLYCNGQKITKGILAPYISNPSHICYYDRYDILPYIQDGDNVLVMQLGNGMQNAQGGILWDFDIASFRDVPKLAFALEIKEQGKEEYVIEADEKVLCKSSPVWFDDLRSGCFYDANKEDAALYTNELEGWKVCFPAKAPEGEAMLCMAEPIVLQREIRAMCVVPATLAEYHSNKGGGPQYERLHNIRAEYVPETREGYLYDFGENIAGIVRLKIKGNKNQKVELQFCEYIDKNGNPSYNNMWYYPDGYAQRDVYICKGEGEEIFEPQFTYHGFRYCVVMGISEEQATADLITAIVCNSDLKRRSHFSCSDETTNTLYEMMIRSDLSNFYYFPTDCPHREKNGWTGDIHVSCEHLLMNFFAEESLAVWLDNVAKAQDENGRIPGIVPTGEWGYGWGNGPAWDSAMIEIPYKIYKFTGKTEVLEKIYPHLLRYLTYLKIRQNEKGLIGYGLGDWLQPGHPANNPDVPVLVTDSILSMDFARKTYEILEILDVQEPKTEVNEFYQKMRGNIRKHLMDFDTMTVLSECQTAQAMGIYYGVFEEEELAEARQRLLEIIEKDDKHLNCGMLGLHVIFHVLADMGQADLAYEMITRKDFPSYGYFVEQGLTTFPEEFQRDYTDKVASLNHHFFGDVGNWFIRHIAGIRVDEDLNLHNTITVKPNFIKTLNWAKADYKTEKGLLSVEWKREGKVVEVSVTKPEGIEVKLELPKDCV